MATFVHKTSVMELRQLKYFVEVGRLKSYSQASKTLFITQSTISQQIQNWKRNWGLNSSRVTPGMLPSATMGSSSIPAPYRSLKMRGPG